AVWEEVILHLPESVNLVSLSATVSNAEEFGEWLQAVRGDTTVIVEEHRPVPLWQSVLVGNRLHDLFVSPLDRRSDADRPSVNPDLVRLAADETRLNRIRGDRRPQRGGRRPRSKVATPHRADTINVFIFSRAGCDAAVRQCRHSGIWLTEPDDRRRIRQIVEQRSTVIPDDDLAVLGYAEFLDGLERGIAAHHAGMLPV